MWQARGSDTWPVPERRHHRSRRGARPMGLLLKPIRDAAGNIVPPKHHVRFAPLLARFDEGSAVEETSPGEEAAARREMRRLPERQQRQPPRKRDPSPGLSPPGRLSPLWYTSPPTSAPSSPMRSDRDRESIPSARMSLLGFTRPAER